MDKNVLRFYVNRAKELQGDIVKGWGNTLQLARQCGDVLNEVRKCFPKRSKNGWKTWVKSTFADYFSYETCQVYRFVTNNWDCPEMMDAREKGIEPKSINSMLRFIKKSLPVKKQVITPKTPIREIINICRKELRQKFTGKLWWMHYAELYLFNEWFEHYWELLEKEISKDTSEELGFDLNSRILLRKCPPYGEHIPVEFLNNPKHYDKHTFEGTKIPLKNADIAPTLSERLALPAPTTPQSRK